MNALPPEYPDRRLLADEVHARPTQAVTAPSRVTQIAMLATAELRAAECTHLDELSRAWGVAGPPPQARFFEARGEAVELRWERHGEFSSYTIRYKGDVSGTFENPPELDFLPQGWLAGIPGQTLFAAHALVLPMPAAPIQAESVSHYFAHAPVGSQIGGGAGAALSDFRIYPDGFSRLLVLDGSLTPRQTGRMLQRLFEIEAYRMLALLGLPLARRLWPRITDLEQGLMRLTEDVARQGTNDTVLLGRLSAFAAEVEHEISQSQGRFAASRAYHDLVTTRVQELRETRLPGVQPIGEFMARRFVPATQTIASVERRLHALSGHLGRVSSLLAARVSITQEAQNQQLLTSLDRRAEMQLRLQQVVESLSVAAIVYYGSGLVAHLAEALAELGLHVRPAVVVAVSIPLIAAGCIVALRRAHRRLANTIAPGA